MQREDHWLGLYHEIEKHNKGGIVVGNVRVKVLSG